MEKIKFGYIKGLIFFGVMALSSYAYGSHINRSHVNRSAPVITRIIPQSGSQKGGTRIMIQGFNFDKESVVKMGDSICPSTRRYKLKSTDVIIARIPQGPTKPRRTYVTVTNSKGESSAETPNSMYTYSYLQNLR